MHEQFGEYILRDLRPEDAPSIARYADNRNIWRNLTDGFPHPYTLEDAKAYIYRINAATPRTAFAVATENEAIGSIGIYPGKDVHCHSAEMGYWLAEPYWGRGIMPRAVKIITAFAFDQLNLLRVFAEPYTTNPASARVLEKAGFIREGILHANVVKAGKLLDQYLYAAVNPQTFSKDEK